MAGAGEGKLLQGGRGYYWRKGKGFAVERRVVGLRGHADAKFWTGWFPTERQAAHAADLTSWYLYRHHHNRIKNSHMNFPASYRNLQAALHPTLRPLQSLPSLLLPRHKSLFVLSCLLYVAKVAPHSNDSARLKDFMDKNKDLLSLDTHDLTTTLQELSMSSSDDHHHHNAKTNNMVQGKTRKKIHDILPYNADIKGESEGKEAYREGVETAQSAQGHAKKGHTCCDYRGNVRTKASQSIEKKSKRTHNIVAQEGDKGHSGNKKARETQKRKLNIEKEMKFGSVEEAKNRPKKKRKRKVLIEGDEGEELEGVEAQLMRQKVSNHEAKVQKHDGTHSMIKRRSLRLLKGHHPQQCCYNSSILPKIRKAIKEHRKWVVFSSPSSCDEVGSFPKKKNDTYTASNAKTKLKQAILPQYEGCIITNDKNEESLKEEDFNKSSVAMKRDFIKTNFSTTPLRRTRQTSRPKMRTFLSTTLTSSPKQQPYLHSTKQATQRQGESSVDENIIGALVTRKVRTSISKRLNDLNFFLDNISEDNLACDPLDFDDLIKEMDLVETINVDVKSDNDFCIQSHSSVPFDEASHNPDFGEEVEDWLEPLKDSLQDVPFLNIDDCLFDFEPF